MYTKTDKYAICCGWRTLTISRRYQLFICGGNSYILFSTICTGEHSSLLPTDYLMCFSMPPFGLYNDSIVYISGCIWAVNYVYWWFEWHKMNVKHPPPPLYILLLLHFHFNDIRSLAMSKQNYLYFVSLCGSGIHLKEGLIQYPSEYISEWYEDSAGALIDHPIVNSRGQTGQTVEIAAQYRSVASSAKVDERSARECRERRKKTFYGHRDGRKNGNGDLFLPLRHKFESVDFLYIHQVFRLGTGFLVTSWNGILSFFFTGGILIFRDLQVFNKVEYGDP